MGFMTPALDKIFIGYDTRSGIDADHDSPRAFLIVSQDGAIEAWVDEAYLRFAKPIHWEVCASEAGVSCRQAALLEARRVARSLGLIELSRQRREAPRASQPTVREAVTVLAPKGPGLTLRLEV